jgi:hypothetical protein
MHATVSSTRSGKPGRAIKIIHFPRFNDNGPGSVVGIATTLRVGRFGDQIPVGARFSAPVQTGPGAHPVSCSMGTGSFPWVKGGRGVTLTTNLLLVPWS